MSATRRQVIAGLGAATVLPRAAIAAPGNDVIISGALDEATMLPPDRALARLKRISAARASLGARLDLIAARAGLRIDLALTRAPASSPERFSLQMQRVAGDNARLPVVARDLEHARRALTARATCLFDRLEALPGTIGSRFEALWRDPRYVYLGDDGGRAAAIADMRATLAAIRPWMPALFGPLPAECLDVEIRDLGPAEIAAGKGGYRILPTPGTRGCYVVDLKQIRRRPTFSLPCVVAHELLPGHMIQMPLEGRAAPHPLRLRYAAAFSEGWAIYAEMLMDAVGLFRTPVDQLGQIHWMLFRICRGLVDIAVHTGSVNVVQAREMLLRWQGEPAYFASFEDDINRLSRKPAMFAAEAWVALHLRRRKPRHQRDWPAFHTNVLRHGRIRTEQLLLGRAAQS